MPFTQESIDLRRPWEAACPVTGLLLDPEYEAVRNTQGLKRTIAPGEVESVVEALQLLARVATNNSCANGFWNHPNLPEKIALIGSECVGEALNALREPALVQSTHIPGFTNYEEELADTIIRCLDAAEAVGLDIAGAVVAKMNYNATRPYKHGSKRF